MGNIGHYDELAKASGCCKLSYSFFRDLYRELEKRMPNDWKIAFRAYHSYAPKIDTSGIDKKTLLFLWGDEGAELNYDIYQSAAGCIYKHHTPENWVTDRFQGTPPEYFWEEGTPNFEELRSIPTGEREQVFMFVGNLHSGRIDFYRGLRGKTYGYPAKVAASNLSNGQKKTTADKITAHILLYLIRRLGYVKDFSYLFSQSTIRFTDTFADTKKGLCYADYWRELCRTRIVLAPPGFRSAETVRHIEAARAGCVVISAPLPQHEFYRDCPFIICKDWRKILPLMMEVAEDVDELTRIGAATRKWYEEHFTPRAWAIRIAAHVRRLDGGELTP